MPEDSVLMEWFNSPVRGELPLPALPNENEMDWSSEEERKAVGELCLAKIKAWLLTPYNPSPQEQKAADEHYRCLKRWIRMNLEEEIRKEDERELEELAENRRKWKLEGANRSPLARRFAPSPPAVPSQPIVTPVQPQINAEAPGHPVVPPQAPAEVTPTVPPPSQINAEAPPATPKPKTTQLNFRVDEDVAAKMRDVVYFYGAKNQQHFLEQLLLKAIDDMEEEQRLNK
jgi:hypothetical protein